MKLNSYGHGLLQGILVGIVALSGMWARGQSLSDFGAVPALSRPPQDQAAANQKLDFHTDLFTGRFAYRVPISVPPARGGSEPVIALEYNSSGGNGWCGVGWDLDMGYIQRETRRGVPVSGSSYSDSLGFVFSLAGQSGRLVHATDGSYRPEINTAFLRFDYNGSYWVATDKGGRKYTFGDSTNCRMANPYGTFRWALSAVRDANGNKTTVSYQTGTYSDGQLYLSQINYNANDNSPSIAANCAVIFTLETTTRPDPMSSCLSGTEVQTSRRLQSVTVQCNGSQVRRYALAYISSSSTGRSLLYGVTEYGTDNATSFPPVTFGYQIQNQSFDPPVAWPMSRQNTQDASGYSPSALNAQLVDINGDGLPDWVTAPSSWPYDHFNVQLNTGSGFSSAQTSWSVVTNEDGDASQMWNTLNGMGGGHVLSSLVDMNGDMLPDRVLRRSSYPYSHLQAQTNSGTGFQAIRDMNGVTNRNSNFGATDMNAPSGSTGDGIANYSLLADINGDGLPDRVMMASVNGRFDVQLNANGSFSSLAAWNNVTATGGTYPYAPRARDYYHVYSELMDMNGDGLPDRVVQGGVQLNNGVSGFGGVVDWGFQTGEDPEAVEVTNGDYTKQLIDINGDGLPDLVFYYSDGVFLVYFNTGRGGFSDTPVYWTGVDTDGNGTTGWDALQAWDNYGTKVMFIDMNGDGLPDRVKRNYQNGQTALLVQLNSGPFPDLLIAVTNGIGGTVSVTYEPSTHYDNSDGTRPRLPMPVYTVASVYADDGIRSGNTTTYGYRYGLYDTTYREFRGFAIVDESDSLGMTTETYFSQGGGRDLSNHGEYHDSRFKAGMAYDVITYGSDSHPYKETLSLIDQIRVDANGVYFPFVDSTIEFDSELPGYPRCSLKTYTYDATADNLANSTGNLIQEAALGEAIDVGYDFTGTMAGDPPVYTTYAYAVIPSNSDIRNRPRSITVSADAAGQAVLRQTTNDYFAVTGNLKQTCGLICPGNYAVTSCTYDSYGNRTAETDPGAIITTTDYDSATATFPWRKYTGNLSDNLIEYFSYDPRSGALAGATNLQGMVTANGYDALLRLANTFISTNRNGAPVLWRTTYQYYLGGMSMGSTYNYTVVFKNDPADLTYGYHVSYTFLDGYGRPVQVRDESETTGQYRVSDVFYDPRGNVIAQTLPAFQSGANFVVPSGSAACVYTDYDPIGRVRNVYPCATASFAYGVLASYPTPQTGDSGSPLGPTSFTYGDGVNPWAVAVWDARGKVRKYYLDAFGRTNQIVEVTDSADYTTSLAYDQVGNLTNITDSANNQTGFFYDCLGRRVAVADPDMGFWQYGFDAAGRLKVLTDAKGQQIKYYYNDPAGRVTRREGWNAAGHCVSTNTWAYDSNAGDTPYTSYPGQIYRITDDQGWQKFSHDVRGRTLKSVRYLSKNGSTYTNQFTFDDADRLASTIYPNGGPTVTNLYDAGEHLKEAKRVDGGGANITYYATQGFDEFNRLTGITFGNGAVTTFGYYPVSKRLNKLATALAGGTTVQNTTNRYDEAGNIVAIQDNVAAHTGAASATLSSAVYDDLNRLSSATWAGYGSKGYGYNSVGNVLTNGEFGAGCYGYASVRPHSVRIANGVRYTYDLNGNMALRGGQRLDYDVNNRLFRVLGTNAVVTTFGYDANGERLWEQTGSNSLQVWIGGLYEERGGKGLYHVLADGRRVCTFEPAAGGATGYNPTTQEFYYYHSDYLGSSSVMTDRTGTNTVQHYEYSAFGQGRYTQSSTAFPVSRRYTGQVLDEDTGLYYYNARYYDPQLGRFVQPDELIPDLFNPQSYNRYAYCYNNPLKYTDPSGHWGQEVADWWSSKVGVAAEYYSAGPSHWIYNGTVGTVNSLVGGVAAPLTLGSSAGSVSANPNATAKDYAIATVTETANAAAVIPAAAGIGKGVGMVVKSEMSVIRELNAAGLGELGGSTSARAARRQAMREAEIPTSQQPSAQVSVKGPDGMPAGRQLTYETPKPGGGLETKSVQHSLSDNVPGHGPHWEAGRVKPGGQTDSVGRPRLMNDKAKVEE